MSRTTRQRTAAKPRTPARPQAPEGPSDVLPKPPAPAVAPRHRSAAHAMDPRPLRPVCTISVSAMFL